MSATMENLVKFRNGKLKNATIHPGDAFERDARFAQLGCDVFPTLFCRIHIDDICMH